MRIEMPELTGHGLQLELVDVGHHVLELGLVGGDECEPGLLELLEKRHGTLGEPPDSPRRSIERSTVCDG